MNTSPATRRPKHGGDGLKKETLCPLPGTSEFDLAMPITVRSAPGTGITLKEIWVGVAGSDKGQDA
jgi:hypothetical protein